MSPFYRDWADYRTSAKKAKLHLGFNRVYDLIARSQYGLMVQILASLITYLLLVIYCHEEHSERTSN
ncbi:MAG: hypothetical protein COB33_009580 [Thiotrichaceae bacterium]|nr:hypothetical protein [Thiotrichaceae bacterium]